MKNVDEFLKELSELTEKYQIFIGGCGCCDSPWLWQPGKYKYATRADKFAGKLEYNFDLNEYQVKEISDD